MIKRVLTIGCVCSALALPCAGQASHSPLRYVDTRIGTAASVTKTAGLFGKSTEEYGQVLPAVLEPHGMNFWTPQTRDTEQKCRAPYYYADTRIQGFRNSHWIVGGCTQDYGSMTLMPLTGQLVCSPEARSSAFSHDTEVATPAYYSVYMDDYKLQAEMTGQSRSAIFRFTYSEAGEAYLVVNPNSDEGEGSIEIDCQAGEIRGYNPVHRIYQGWGKPAGFSGHFVIRFQKEIAGYGVYEGSQVHHGQASISNKPGIGAFVRFKVNKGEQVLVKAASSFTDGAGAAKNLQAEIPHWDFEAVRKRLSGSWNRHLSKVEATGGTREDANKFYGALYRSSFLPRVFNDVDGRYPAFSAGTPILQKQPIVGQKETGDYYEDFSMWDTYRALHPLLTIIDPERTSQMVQSLVDKYEQGGWLPIFPCWNSYTAAMIGDHCISVISDAYVKGIRDFDVAKAYEGMRKNAFTSPDNEADYKNGMGRRALPSYLKYGYIPLEDSVMDAFHTHEQVSRTLEYAYDDFALAQVAKGLKKEADYKALMKRAGNYAHVIDPATGYAQGRRADGTFLQTDNSSLRTGNSPLQAGGNSPFRFARFITEGAPCHYTWYVPHDPAGLMQCMGGKEAFVMKLDSMFAQRYYWHGNEPCHQVAYLFNYAGQPWKTQQHVRHVMETEYLDCPGGLSGNDDAGQMSAWYVFAAMGFYPVCPGTPYYVLGSPLFPKLSIHLSNGKTFTVKAHHASQANIYIQSARLNGKVYDKNYISHADILAGATLELEMGNRPNPDWGSAAASCPPSYQLTD